MDEPNTFTDFMRRIRAGDEAAAAELLRHYEPFIRREVRFRLRDRRLNRLFDSQDICQLVLASFFVRAAAGQYDLEEPGQLLKLLVAMSRNKLATQVRNQHCQRRDNRRVAQGGGEELEAVAAAGPTPSRVFAGKELLEQVRQRLSDEERQLADLRAEGHDWTAIAARVGGTAQARRVQLSRAVERVARQLGLDEGEADE
jgi:RNA polymerase sigma-70 factor (ECF subfamily)